MNSTENTTTKSTAGIGKLLLTLSLVAVMLASLLAAPAGAQSEEDPYNPRPKTPTVGFEPLQPPPCVQLVAGGLTIDSWRDGTRTSVFTFTNRCDDITNPTVSFDAHGIWLPGSASVAYYRHAAPTSSRFQIAPAFATARIAPQSKAVRDEGTMTIPFTIEKGKSVTVTLRFANQPNTFAQTDATIHAPAGITEGFTSDNKQTNFTWHIFQG